MAASKKALREEEAVQADEGALLGSPGSKGSGAPSDD